MESFRTPRFTSMLAFVLAGMLATTVHEISHSVAALLVGEKPTLFPGFTRLNDGVSSSHLIVIAGTGPLFSLTTGLLMILLFRNWGRGFVRLFWLWFAFLSAQIGFGYFFAAVISRTGDTGLVLSLLHAPWYVYAIVFGLGAAGSWLFLPRLWANRVSPLVAGKKQFNQVGMYPWLLGTGVLLVIYFIVGLLTSPGQPDLFGLFAIVTIGIFTPIANFASNAPREPRTLVLTSPIMPAVLTIVVALGLIVGLTHGVGL